MGIDSETRQLLSNLRADYERRTWELSKRAMEASPRYGQPDEPSPAD